MHQLLPVDSRINVAKKHQDSANYFSRNNKKSSIRATHQFIRRKANYL